MGAPYTQENPSDELKKPADEAGSSPSSTLQTYLNLVQQYLGVFMVDNAQWLAERCVVDYPASSEAAYLLALCHYRNGSPHAARQILELSKAPKSPSIEYLIAVCSYDMEEYDRAEDVLLRGTRNLFRHSRTDTSVTTLDDWILSTTVSWEAFYFDFSWGKLVSHIPFAVVAMSCSEWCRGYSFAG